MYEFGELSEKEKALLLCDQPERFVPSKMNDQICEEAKLCEPEGYFEMIEKCKLCGKLL